MEAMDYSYFASAAQQPFLGFDGDTLLSGSLTGDGSGIASSLDTSLGGNPFSFDYATFHGSLDSATGLTPHPTNSDSPPAQRLPLLHHSSIDSGIALDMEMDAHERRASSEEKESLTPAQSRRKAQNRAAQRAFRERKERHVRDLEAKLHSLKSTASTLQTDNERLKAMLQRAQTENEILKATATSSPTASNPPSFVDDPFFVQPPQPPPHRDSGYGATDEPHLDAHGLANGLLFKTDLSSSPSAAVNAHGVSPKSEPRMLSASATWDLLQSHPLYLSGVVDIGEVCERLKKMAKCDGLGPMFEEEEVRKVIDDVGSGGGDELL